MNNAKLHSNDNFPPRFIFDLCARGRSVSGCLFSILHVEGMCLFGLAFSSFFVVVAAVFSISLCGVMKRFIADIFAMPVSFDSVRYSSLFATMYQS